MLLRLASLIVCLGLIPSPASAQPDLQIAELDTCALEKGGVVEDCRIGYRTFGRLNSDRSNAVLFPTWFTGRSEDLMEFLGPEGLVDTTRFFVVLVDAFGNGVSSSPSNSASQPDWSFPEFTIRDVVEAQHRFATEHLALPSLHAVVGISMGGMQAYQWAVSYPEYVQKAVSIVGTPRLTPYDVLLWVTELGAIRAAGHDKQLQQQAMEFVARVHALALETPERVSERPEEEFDRQLEARIEDAATYNPIDWASQIRAMLNHDIYAPFDRFEDVKDHIQADMLIVVDDRDHMVNPRPSRQFAEITGATLLEFETECGHQIFSCVGEQIEAEVSAFLSQD